MFLAPVIVFVGIAGKHPAAVEHQLAPVLAHAHIESRELPPRELGNLARHGDASRDIVRGLHVGGVVAGALIESGGSLTLRVVIYDGKGNLKSLGETPLEGRTMTKDELDVVGDNIAQELADLAPAPEAPATPAQEPEPELEPSPTPEAAGPTSPSSPSDAVSLDDVAALNSGSDVDAAPAPAASSGGGLRLVASAGLGIASRSFSTPATVMGYASSPVGTVHVDAGISPVAHLTIGAMGEKAIEMSSPIGSTSASTTMTRWEITAAYAFHAGRVAIAPTIGYGQRDFEIASSSMDRSPDTSYGYLLGGATAALPIGSRITARAQLDFEPVTGGAEPTAMTYGPATRWAFDVGASVDVRIVAHLTARAAFDYQQFAWSWSAAGTRGATSATDAYPTAIASLTADY